MSGLRLFNLKGGVTEVVPHLAEAEAAVAHLPQPENSRTLTAFAAGLGGYWEKASRRPAPPGIPFLRPTRSGPLKQHVLGCGTGPSGSERASAVGALAVLAEEAGEPAGGPFEDTIRKPVSDEGVEALVKG
ncbi:hypothetical protein Slala04_02350 [Streptomyces lavendulae subsp. lavendulae]|nr:hypothetical protein Slala04_02350 [Streptomyces lavendulae subsp. lavendulae]